MANELIQAPLPKSLAAKYVRQITKSLIKDRDNNRPHPAISASNLRINEKGRAVLTAPDGETNLFPSNTASDIYDLGAILYFLVSGQNPPAQSLIQNDELPRPEGLKGYVWKAIKKAMRSNPADRPQSLEELLDLLQKPETTETAPVETAKATDTVVQEAVVKEAVVEKAVQEAVVQEAIVEKTVKSNKRYLWLLLVLVPLVILLLVFILPKGKKGYEKAEVESPVSKQKTSMPDLVNGHEYVDLGLSVLWANCNVGASAPGEYGNFYAWGETAPKSKYSHSNYALGKQDCFTKYVPEDLWEYAWDNSPDNLLVLESEDDAATINWGDPWRMPTQKEFEELASRCTSEWTQLGGHDGTLFTGPNGNSVFFPAAGIHKSDNYSDAGIKGFYWSSSLKLEDPKCAYRLFFDSTTVGAAYWHGRYYGYTVRPVCSKTKDAQKNQNNSQTDEVLKGALMAAERLLDESDFYDMSLEDLRILRNSIYARHGYIFKSEELKAFFSQYDWYHPTSTNVSSELSKIEKKNVEFIKAHE